MYWLYNVVVFTIFLFSLPYLLVRGIFGRHGLRQRFGFLPKQIRRQLPIENLVWVHAASIGEVRVIPSLLTAIGKQRGLNFIISTSTKTGYALAGELFKNKARFIFYQPLDLPFITRKVASLIDPKALLLVETELWPNLIKSARRQGALVGMVNGRISSRSFTRYKVIRSLTQEVLNYIDFFAIQTETDLHRLNQLGARVNRMKVVGSLKFDQSIQNLPKPSDLTRQTLGIPEGWSVLVAGSTRPGEEQIVLSAYRKLQEQKQIVLILAPRHLDRIAEIELLMQQGKFNYLKRSQLTNGSSSRYDILLLDSMGELAQIYSLADLAFVGGSLVPLGGHNPLEPAVYGIPVLFGPYMEHTQEAAELLISSGLGFKVRDEEEFLAVVERILRDGLDVKSAAANFQRALQENSGAAEKTSQFFFANLNRISG